jgi:hypothetical protein
MTTPCTNCPQPATLTYRYHDHNRDAGVSFFRVHEFPVCPDCLPWAESQARGHHAVWTDFRAAA